MTAKSQGIVTSLDLLAMPLQPRIVSHHWWHIFSLLLTRIPVQERCYSLGTAEYNYRAICCGIFFCGWGHSLKAANCPLSLKLPNEPSFLTSTLPNNSQKYAFDKMLFFGDYCGCKLCLLSQSLCLLPNFCTSKSFGLVANQWQYHFGTGKHSCS